jgi:2-polyprenyl-6-methoxyphenol hydroxylase-like FAD-dependent oxidoreductase
LLRRASFELRRGVEVVSVLRDGERIAGVRTRDRATNAESDVVASFTIGDDGEHSLVRSACGIAIETQPFPLEFLCFALRWPSSFEPAVTRVWIDPRSRESGIVALAGMPFARGLGAGLVVVRASAFDVNDELQSAWRQFTSLDPAMAEIAKQCAFPDGMARVRRSFGHAARYGAAGAFVLGDAAHPVSPAGGQGANMAIADARVLAAAISENGADALDPYQRARWASNERSVGISRNAARALSLPSGWPSSAALFAVRSLARRGWVVRRALRAVASSFLERS